VHERVRPVEPRSRIPAVPAGAEAAPAPAPLYALAGAQALRGGGAQLARAALAGGLQARHGNAVVARAAVLARQNAERTEKIAAFNAAKGKDWGLAAEILNGFDDADIQRLLGGLKPHELRQLDAGALRRIPAFAGRVHEPTLQRLGKAPGSVFGRLNVLLGAPEHGGGPMTAYALPVDFSFAPDADVVNADKIAYVQTVRLVRTGTDEDADWQEASKRRQTDDHWAVDRATGGQSGFAGYQTNQQPGPHVTEWAKEAPGGFATYHDRPSAQLPSTDWSFETAVVGKGGADDGVIYSSCAWGFVVDANCVLTPKATKISDKPSRSFGAAAEKWNEQQAGPQEQRNAPGQERLPSLR
jgi:hypothetical protein